ncbi:MAG: hypothetical protein WBH90_11570 [Aggregatilineales bacterium]|nr:phenylacetate--CoA ligase family protein [Chloroflexota bacterium]HPV05772.1 AMP-binding protein [Aggregatilineales bacterium]HQE17729.1 AMP-binding protein [Aggregatilineales bacterium]
MSDNHHSRREQRSGNPFWTALLRGVLLPAGDRLFGQRMMQRLKFLESAQWWEAERIRDYREQLLSSLVQTAYSEVPFYRQLWDEAKVDVNSIRSVDDLQRLPIVTKDLLRQQDASRISRATGQRTYRTCTSGSTGTPFCIQEDARTAGWYRASFMLSLEWAGWTIGERHLQTGMTLKRSQGRWLKDLLLRCHYVSAYDLRDEKLDAALEQIERYRIQHLWGYPGSLYYLARRARELGWNQPLKSAVTWGDMLYPPHRKLIESTFQTRVFDTYGCAEGLQIAAQCGCSSGYHIHELDVIVEYLDDNGQPVQAGEPGNVVITRLHPGPTPLIRYFVGDIAVSAKGQVCGCKRNLELLASVQGRNADVVLTPSGNRLIVHFFTGILEHFIEIRAFQVVQENIDSMLIRVVPQASYSEETTVRVVKALQQHGADDIDIRVELAETLPLSPTGKHRFIISQLEKQL